MKVMKDVGIMPGVNVKGNSVLCLFPRTSQDEFFKMIFDGICPSSFDSIPADQRELGCLSCDCFNGLYINRLELPSRELYFLEIRHPAAQSIFLRDLLKPGRFPNML